MRNLVVFCSRRQTETACRGHPVIRSSGKLAVFCKRYLPKMECFGRSLLWYRERENGFLIVIVLQQEIGTGLSNSQRALARHKGTKNWTSKVVSLTLFCLRTIAEGFQRWHKIALPERRLIAGCPRFETFIWAIWSWTAWRLPMKHCKRIHNSTTRSNRLMK